MNIQELKDEIEAWAADAGQEPVAIEVSRAFFEIGGIRLNTMALLTGKPFTTTGSSYFAGCVLTRRRHIGSSKHWHRFFTQCYPQNAAPGCLAKRARHTC